MLRYAPLLLMTLIGCGESADSPTVTEESAFACAPPHTVAVATDLNYPDPEDCAGAAVIAASQLGGLHYRRACEAVGEAGAPPPSISAARVTECRTTDGRGVFVDVEVCCVEGVQQILEPERVTRAAGPNCPSWRTRVRKNNLHYPDVSRCELIVARAEADLASTHYRKACKSAAPRATRPARVLEARVVECRSGGKTPGVSVDIELCCEAKVFEESTFRDLVMQRSPDRIRAALGTPQEITEQPPGTHWSYPVEVARGDRIFPGVTLVFVDGQVDSYYF